MSLIEAWLSKCTVCNRETGGYYDPIFGHYCWDHTYLLKRKRRSFIGKLQCFFVSKYRRFRNKIQTIQSRRRFKRNQIVRKRTLGKIKYNSFHEAFEAAVKQHSLNQD